MTLGEYIEILEKADQEKVLKVGLGNPHSWRGSYDELAFEPVENVTVSEMLKSAKEALGSTYQGYKGGEYKMEAWVTVNVDYEGHYSDGSALWKMLFAVIL